MNNKRGKNRFSLAILMVLMIITFFYPIQSYAAAKPSLSKKQVELMVGESVSIGVKSEIKGSKYTWKTSDKKIVTVSSKGVIKAKKSGNATITCKIVAGKKTYTLKCEVTVIGKDTTHTITTESKASTSTKS